MFDGGYQIVVDWVVVCDGVLFLICKMLNFDFEGCVFEDSFLIVDIKMILDSFLIEWWFWFELWFKFGVLILLYCQFDDVWCVDFQIGWDVDCKEELKEENICKWFDVMLGDGVEYDIVWLLIYMFQC